MDWLTPEQDKEPFKPHELDPNFAPDKAMASAGPAAAWALRLPPVAKGSKADRYLHSRCVGLGRYPPDLRMDREENLVVLIRSPEGYVASYQRTLLKEENGAWIKDRKMMKNPEGHTIPPGSAIRLGRAGITLGAAEGTENALSAALLTGRSGKERFSVWATVTANGMKTFRPPATVERYVVFADHDANGLGLRAAEESIAGSLAKESHILLPPFKGTDWNDVWRRLKTLERGSDIKEIMQMTNARVNSEPASLSHEYKGPTLTLR